MLQSEVKADKWELELYVAGDTRQSRYAIQNLRSLCKNHLKDFCNIKVIDLREHPDLAARNNICGVPALVKSYPGPKKVLVGDLSQTEKVLIGLELQARPLKSDPVYHSPVSQNRL